MSYEMYCELIDTVCQQLGIPDPQSNYELCQINVDDNKYSLGYIEAEPECLIAFCHFGDVPEQRAVAILRRLLEINMLMFSAQAPRFSINPDTGRVLLIIQIPLEGLTYGALMEALVIFSRIAKNWRKNFLLDMSDDDILKLSHGEKQKMVSA